MTFASAAGNQPSEGPFTTMFASSVNKLLNMFELIFESVDRADLNDSLGDRLQRYNEFSGINKDRPLGIMFTWGNDNPQHIVFLPATDIESLLTTSTFGCVGFHRVGDDHYEIERPGKPYHVLVKDDYAFLADSLTSVRSIRLTPDRLTQGLSERYDFAIHFDLLQIPKATKLKFAADIRQSVEPLLQPGDEEATESAGLRRALGLMILGVIERVVIDTTSIKIGIHLDPNSRQFSVEVVVEAAQNSRMESNLWQFGLNPSELARILEGDVPAASIVQIPSNGMIDQILGHATKTSTRPSKLELGIQLVGTSRGEFSLITAVHGSEVETLNQAIPHLLSKADDSGHFQRIKENVDICHGVILHQLFTNRFPEEFNHWFGRDLGLVIGQGKKTIWMGLGPEQNLFDHLQEAIESVEETTSQRTTLPWVQGKIHGAKFPELFVSDLLLPELNAERIEEVLSQSADELNLKVVPTRNGLKLRIDFAIGFTKLVAHDWVRQIERAN